MRSNEVLREAAETVGVKVLAGRLRLSPALIYKWCQEANPGDPDTSGTRNPLDRLREIIEVTGHIPVVNWLCHEANGFFVHNPEAACEDIDADLLQSTQHLVMAFSRLLKEVSESVANDGAIEPDEADRIRADWEQLKTTAETFVAACERGVYRKKRA
ncbi:MAG: phage regulatory CII family protein [Phycisphaerae bacterium]